MRTKIEHGLPVCRPAMRRCAQSRAPLGSHSVGFWSVPVCRSVDAMRMTASWSGPNQKARLAVHRRSACSGVKALRNTSDAGRQAAKLCYRFGPLTPSARSANLIAGDGTKNGLSRSEQRTATNQKPLLDTKSPIQMLVGGSRFEDDLA